MLLRRERNRVKKDEKMYEAYLCEEGKEHSGIIFNQYIQENGKRICPGDGVVVYEGGKVRCSLHLLDEGDGGEGDVPYL